MSYESLMNNGFITRTKYSSQNVLGEWTYTYSSASTSTKCRMNPLSASERLDRTGLYDDVRYKCYCLSSASINRGDQVIYDNKNYKVKEVIQDSSFHHKKALLKEIT